LRNIQILRILLKKEQKYFGKKIPVVGDLNQVPLFSLFFTPPPDTWRVPTGYTRQIHTRHHKKFFKWLSGFTKMDSLATKMDQ
jgi:hypothetical protein